VGLVIYVVLSLAAIMILASIADWILSKADWRICGTGMAAPTNFAKWIDWFKYIDRDGGTVYVLAICLPAYREAYQIAYDDWKWSQRVLIHHTKRGWFLIDVPVVNP
jgi:hypothetical protein